MVGIIDKPRDGIETVIRTCRQAGVRVFMVTGDFYVTAAAIASQIGIFSSSDKYDTIEAIREHKSNRDFNLDAASANDASTTKKPIWRRMLNHLPCFRPAVTAPFIADHTFRSLLLTGTDLDMLNDENDWNVITKYEEIVFARTTPSQKLKVVEEFKKRRNIVAVTGDGVNDSPALKAANIGIAMGGGSEVAMEASQMVLLDNTFNSIVVAIENGRLVFENLRKVILYLLPAGTFSQIVPLILNIYIGVPLPLSAFQMIIICILTDVAPSLSMMFEKSEGDLLERPPRVIGRDRLVDLKLLMYAYFFLGVLETFFSNFIFFVYLYWYGNFQPSQVFLAYGRFAPSLSDDERSNLINTGQTISFVTLVIVQTFGNVYVTRTHKLSLFQSLPVLKSHRNLFLFIAQLIAVAIMLIIIYVPVFNSIFKTAPIPVQFYFIPLGFCILFIVVDELRKLALRMALRSSNPSWFFRFIIKWAW
jgi:sodium/potassium-transporting ATPase subunit alpha